MINTDLFSIIKNRPMFHRISSFNKTQYRVTVYNVFSKNFEKICIGIVNSYDEAITIIENYKLNIYVTRVSKYIHDVNYITTGIVYNNMWVVYSNGLVFDLCGNNIHGDINRYGYQIIRRTNKDGSHYRISLHRLVALCYIPNPYNKPQINHKDGNKLNNDISNLEWCTASENIIHSYNSKLHVVNTKLSLNEIQEIVDLYNSGLYSYLELSKIFGVSNVTISNYVDRYSFQDF